MIWIYKVSNLAWGKWQRPKSWCVKKTQRAQHLSFSLSQTLLLVFSSLLLPLTLSVFIKALLKLKIFKNVFIIINHCLVVSIRKLWAVGLLDPQRHVVLSDCYPFLFCSFLFVSFACRSSLQEEKKANKSKEYATRYAWQRAGFSCVIIINDNRLCFEKSRFDLICQVYDKQLQ